MPANVAIDRLVRKEVSLGTIREKLPPTNHIGLQLIAPFLDVQSDDVIFDYAKGLTEGLAPARAEDAESELAQKDETFVGTGRAAVIDWALKDRYSASDVTRYRELQTVLAQMQNGGSLPLGFTGRMVEDFAAKLARNASQRRRKLDNRIEWMIMTGLETGAISYNDGKIKWTVDFGRPADQTDEAPSSGNLWSATNSDPIGDFFDIDEFMYNRYGVRMGTAIASRKVWNSIANSDRFLARTGLALPASPASPSAPATVIDPRYLIDGWGDGAAAARAVFERVTGLKTVEYDSVYRTRAVGSNTVVNNRFTSQNKVIFLPKQDELDEIDDTEIGFAKTLTSPHPEGNWEPGFYEWERETVDPWGRDVGTGIKAFPVFPHLEYSYTATVLA